MVKSCQDGHIICDLMYANEFDYIMYKKTQTQMWGNPCLLTLPATHTHSLCILS